MTANILDIPKRYADGEALFESMLDDIRLSTVEWALDAVRNLEQIAKDAFGATYSLDNDGNTNLAVPLIDACAFLSENETVTGDWTISGSWSFTEDVCIYQDKKLIFESDVDSDTYIWSQDNNIIQFFAGGNSAFNVFNDGIVIPSTYKIRLDGSTTGNTFISETSADVIGMTCNGDVQLRIADGLVQTQNAADFAVPSNAKYYLDGGNDTYFEETSANQIDTIVGGTARFRVSGTRVETINATAFAVPSGRYVYLDGGSDTGWLETSANVIRGVAGGTDILDLSSSAVELKDSVDFEVGTNGNMAVQSGQYMLFRGLGGSNVSIRSTGATQMQIFGGTANYSMQVEALRVTLNTGVQLQLPNTDPPVANSFVSQSSVKGHWRGNVTGASAASTTDDFNVSSISVSSYAVTVNWDTNMSGNDYGINVSRIGANNLDFVPTITSQSSGSCVIDMHDISSGTGVTANYSASVSVSGSQ